MQFFTRIVHNYPIRYDSTQPDLTWHWVEIFTKLAEKMGDEVGENPVALRAAVFFFFLLSSKNLRGRSNAPPPQQGAG